MPDNLIGKILGRYQLDESLGKGGMAAVYKAHDERLDRDVAIKVILPSQQQSQQFLKRFEREARTLAKLTHPNIVPIIDYGKENNMPYLVMPYLSGGTLEQKLTGVPISPEKAAQILVPIARALYAAHQSGIVHRDIKPANILLTKTGEVMLSDFGIAKLLQEEGSSVLTGAGVGIGTPAYMSPEQAQGNPVDARTDIYSLAVVFYEMVTGCKPFTADTPMGVAIKHITEPLPSPRNFVPELLPEIEAILCKALEKEPQHRFVDMAAFAQALDEIARNAISSSTITSISMQPEADKQPTFDISQPDPKAEEATVISAASSVIDETKEKKELVNSKNLPPGNLPPGKKEPGKKRGCLVFLILLVVGFLIFVILTQLDSQNDGQTIMQLSEDLLTTDDIGCLNWSEVSLDHLGTEICVKGDVERAYSNDQAFFILFSNQPQDFFLISYDGPLSVTNQQCIMIEGEVEQLSGAPVIVVHQNSIQACP